MRSLIILTLTLGCVFADTTILENTSDEALASEEAVTILKCLLKEGPCSGLGNSIDDAAHAHVANTCANCSPILKHKLGIYFNYIRLHYPERFEQFMDKIDPEKKTRVASHKFLDERL